MERARPAQPVGRVLSGLREGPAAQARALAPSSPDAGQRVCLVAAACAAGRTFLLCQVEPPLRIAPPREEVRARAFVVFTEQRSSGGNRGVGTRQANRAQASSRTSQRSRYSGYSSRGSNRARSHQSAGQSSAQRSARSNSSPGRSSRSAARTHNRGGGSRSRSYSKQGPELFRTLIRVGPRRPAVIMGQGEAPDVAHADAPAAADSENYPRDSSECPGIQSWHSALTGVMSRKFTE